MRRWERRRRVGHLGLRNLAFRMVDIASKVVFEDWSDMEKQHSGIVQEIASQTNFCQHLSASFNRTKALVRQRTLPRCAFPKPERPAVGSDSGHRVS